ncbi:hypothetical protein BDP27DRAFT_1337485 [Rhodocollybia butyracea]|uniref:Uncharacterized protein n=1 Tax=Rhodocollybia butyracea TaxID=206335 RepID=A0A9P5U107_9AGAR|nr:hypothetical protein BDP27DRAFT_1337485 [Rhodocollybia butyracea]
MPVGEDHVMCGETWSSLTVRLATENELGGKLPYNTTKPCSTMSSSGVLQCPLCLRFSSVKKFGRCIGAPTAEFPLLETQGGMNTRKRKRTESRAAHEVALAPCHDCLDNLGEDEGATWGRCDNADYDARNIDRDGDYSDKHSCFDSILGMPTSKNPISLHPRNLHLDSVNGVDSLGVWRRDLCGHVGEVPRTRIPLWTIIRALTWRCRLCSLPVCKGCVPSANSIHECRNCNSQLCRGCGEDMCQLCLGESLVMLCRKCEDVC